MSRDTDHTCHARGCDESVPPRMFMCREHWFALPKPMRDDIWSAYRPGQEQRMSPSPEYLDAARTARDYLSSVAVRISPP